MVLDASVPLAWWLPEISEAKLYAKAVAQAGREGVVFHAPHVFEAEVAAGLLRAMRARRRAARPGFDDEKADRQALGRSGPLSIYSVTE